jgi:hypothetical protein
MSTGRDFSRRFCLKKPILDSIAQPVITREFGKTLWIVQFSYDERIRALVSRTLCVPSGVYGSFCALCVLNCSDALILGQRT